MSPENTSRTDDKAAAQKAKAEAMLAGPVGRQMCEAMAGAVDALQQELDRQMEAAPTTPAGQRMFYAWDLLVEGLHNSKETLLVPFGVGSAATEDILENIEATSMRRAERFVASARREFGEANSGPVLATMHTDMENVVRVLSAVLLQSAYVAAAAGETKRAAFALVQFCVVGSLMRLSTADMPATKATSVMLNAIRMIDPIGMEYLAHSLRTLGDRYNLDTAPIIASFRSAYAS